jgi:hypothetical protein
MIYRIRHDFVGGIRQYRRGEEITDPDWPNLRSLCEAGYVEPVPVSALPLPLSPRTDHAPRRERRKR